MWHSSESTADEEIGAVVYYVRAVGPVYPLLPFSCHSWRFNRIHQVAPLCLANYYIVPWACVSQSCKRHLDRFSRFCTGHILVQTCTGRGNFQGTCRPITPPRTDHSSKSMRTSTPYVIHSISTILHYSRSIYSHYKISITRDPSLPIVKLTSWNTHLFPF